MRRGTQAHTRPQPRQLTFGRRTCNARGAPSEETGLIEVRQRDSNRDSASCCSSHPTSNEQFRRIQPCSIVQSYQSSPSRAIFPERCPLVLLSKCQPMRGPRPGSQPLQNSLGLSESESCAIASLCHLSRADVLLLHCPVLAWLPSYTAPLGYFRPRGDGREQQRHRAECTYNVLSFSVRPSRLELFRIGLCCSIVGHNDWLTSNAI